MSDTTTSPKHSEGFDMSDVVYAELVSGLDELATTTTDEWLQRDIDAFWHEMRMGREALAMEIMRSQIEPQTTGDDDVRVTILIAIDEYDQSYDGRHRDGLF